jgi:pyruvate dehydrogenase E1 component alpha subunit
VFAEYNPIEGKILQILDEEGNVREKEWMPPISDEQVVQAYKCMLLARLADLKAVSYQRQGRMFTYPPNLGQEAAAVGTAMAMQEEDWLVPAYRELGAWLWRGVSIKDVYLFWGGYEEGAKLASGKNIVPPCVPIASQIPHAVGIAYGLKYKRQKGVVFCYFGEGATSEGDFHEAINFAGVWKAPVLFICQNNQYAISTPTKKQTASRNIAVKAIAYGLQGIVVDGNDLFAVYAAARASANRIRSGGEGVLLECITYRRGAHTTSDDPSRYRPKEEESNWAAKDPLRRLRLYLVGKKLWKEEDDKTLETEYGKELDAKFEEASQYPYKLEDAFRFMYTEIPDHLKKQRLEYEKYLAWKESHPWQS